MDSRPGSNQEQLQKISGMGSIDSNLGPNLSAQNGDGGSLEGVEERFAVMRRLNPDIDFANAVRSERDDSKLSFQITCPNGKIRVLKCPYEFDWGKSVAPLNSWRRTRLRQYFGENPTRPDVCRFHELEKQHLLEVHKQHKRKYTKQKKAVNWRTLNWNDITDDFNQKFANKYLPGCPYERPRRSKSSLYSAFANFEELANLVGKPCRAPGSNKPQKQRIKN